MIRFVLAGEGSERESLIELAQDGGVLGRNLFVIDSLPRYELAGLLSASTVLSSFFIPIRSMESNSANKFFDAFAAGKPVIINYGGWQADLLEENGAGLVLDPLDPEASASRLVQALRDPVWLENASQASRRLGDEVFNRRKLALELESVLLKVAEV
jgi:glycosyltransferase involved in cell wall biosynthesis